MQTFTLNGSWQVKQVGTEEAIPATVPGCVHTDLLAAGKIADPFYRDNEDRLRWIGESEWVYSRTFTLSPQLLTQEKLILRCEGLDTLATVRVNGREIGHADNMFRTWELDLKPVAVEGENTIEVQFASPLPIIGSVIIAAPAEEPATTPPARSTSRMASKAGVDSPLGRSTSTIRDWSPMLRRRSVRNASSSPSTPNRPVPASGRFSRTAAARTRVSTPSRGRSKSPTWAPGKSC